MSDRHGTECHVTLICRASASALLVSPLRRDGSATESLERAPPDAVHAWRLVLGTEEHGVVVRAMRCGERLLPCVDLLPTTNLVRCAQVVRCDGVVESRSVLSGDAHQDVGHVLQTYQVAQSQMGSPTHFRNARVVTGRRRASPLEGVREQSMRSRDRAVNGKPSKNG